MTAVTTAKRVRSKAEIELNRQHGAIGDEAAEAAELEPQAEPEADDPEQQADSVSAQSVRRYQQLAARLRAQAPAAEADAAAIVAKARAALVEAEQHARAVAAAVRNLEPIAVDLEARIRHAAVGQRSRADAQQARTRLEALEAEHAEASARAAVLAEKLAPLRVEFGEVCGAMAAARASGDVDTLTRLRSREAALAEVVGDLEQEHRRVAAQVQALEAADGGLEAARRQLEARERHLADYRHVAGAERVTDAWSPLLNILRAMREGLFTDARREELDEVLRAPDLSGIYGHAQRTLAERIAAGVPLDTEVPNAILRGGRRMRGEQVRRVEEGVDEVYARSADWTDTTEYVFQRTGQLEETDGGIVLRVYQYAGEAH